MTWNKNPNPKSAGWYLCTVMPEINCESNSKMFFDEYGVLTFSNGNETIQDGNYRYVMPLQRCEYPKGNFYWSGLNHGEIIACVKFPKPYSGDIKDDKYEQLHIDI